MREPFKDRLMQFMGGQIPPERGPRMRTVAPVVRRGAGQPVAADAVFQREKPMPEIGIIKRFWYLTLGLFLCAIALLAIGLGGLFLWTMISK